MLRLRKEREARGFTQLDLAARTGIDVATLSKLENGKIFPYAGWRRRLARVLGVSASQLFEEVQDEGANCNTASSKNNRFIAYYEVIGSGDERVPSGYLCGVGVFLCSFERWQGEDDAYYPDAMLLLDTCDDALFVSSMTVSCPGMPEQQALAQELLACIRPDITLWSQLLGALNERFVENMPASMAKAYESKGCVGA